MSDLKCLMDEAVAAIEAMRTETLCEDINPTADAADLISALRRTKAALEAEVKYAREHDMDINTIIAFEDDARAMQTHIDAWLVSKGQAA